MSEASTTNNPAIEGNTQQARQAILSRCDSLETRTVDQHAFVSGIKYILNTTFMSTEATIDAFFEIYPPEVLCEKSCLKLQILFVTLRDVLNLVGINIERRCGLYIPQAIVNSVYESDNVLRNIASSLIVEFNLTNAESTSTSPGLKIEGHSTVNGEGESFWRRVDNAKRRFSDQERYIGILAESPNLAQIRKAYTPYCNQNDFP